MEIVNNLQSKIDLLQLMYFGVQILWMIAATLIIKLFIVPKGNKYYEFGKRALKLAFKLFIWLHLTMWVWGIALRYNYPLAFVLFFNIVSLIYLLFSQSKFLNLVNIFDVLEDD